VSGSTRRRGGRVQHSDFEYSEAPLPHPGNGGVLVRILCLSLDTAMRGCETTGKLVLKFGDSNR